MSYIFGDIHGYFWSDDFDNSTLTPLFTLIPPDRNTTVFAVKVICFLIQSHANANIVLLIAFHLLLTMTFAREFGLLNDRFKTDIRTKINSAMPIDVRCFGNLIIQHQLLAKRVRQVDHYFSGFNGAVVLCEVGLLILALYNVCWYQNPNSNALLIVVNIYFISLCALQLLAVTVGSMLVNQSVSDCKIS